MATDSDAVLLLSFLGFAGVSSLEWARVPGFFCSMKSMMDVLGLLGDYLCSILEAGCALTPLGVYLAELTREPTLDPCLEQD